MEETTGKKVNTILQLRLHPEVVKLKAEMDSKKRNTKHDVVLTYITSRGDLVFAVLEEDSKKSGGLLLISEFIF